MARGPCTCGAVGPAAAQQRAHQALWAWGLARRASGPVGAGCEIVNIVNNFSGRSVITTFLLLIIVKLLVKLVN